MKKSTSPEELVAALIDEEFSCFHTQYGLYAEDIYNDEKLPTLVDALVDAASGSTDEDSLLREVRRLEQALSADDLIFLAEAPNHPAVWLAAKVRQESGG